MDIAGRVKELNEASKAYYNTGHPIMSDLEFDYKLKELSGGKMKLVLYYQIVQRIMLVQ